MNFNKETKELENLLNRSIDSYKNGNFNKKIKFNFSTEGINFNSSTEY